MTDADLQDAGLVDLRTLNEKQYEGLVGRAVSVQYEVLFANIFDYWRERSPEEQWRSIEATAAMVKRWQAEWGMNFLLRGSDIKDGGTSTVLSLEGLYLLDNIERPTRDDADRVLGQLFNTGIRSVILQYNYPSCLADKGLTPLGEYCAKWLLEHGVLLDLAHTQPATRQDLLRLAEDNGRGRQILYTHGAPGLEIAKDPDYSNEGEISRGLTEDDIHRVIRMGGIIGVSVTRPFVQSAQHLAEIFHRLLQVEKGPQSIALGTDFGGIPPALMVGMRSPAEVALVLGDALSERFGVPDAQIDAILRTNIKAWLKQSLRSYDGEV